MPIRSPFYELPEFAKTNIPEVDIALDNWRRDFGAAYSRNLYEAERIPFSITTGSTGTFNLSTVVLGTTVLTKRVGFQGNETVNVMLGARMNLLGGGAVVGSLAVTFPDGGVVQLSSRYILLFSNSSAAVTAVNFWKPPIRVQQGGLHSFSFVAHSVGTTGGQIIDPGMVIQAF